MHAFKPAHTHAHTQTLSCISHIGTQNTAVQLAKHHLHSVNDRMHLAVRLCTANDNGVLSLRRAAFSRACTAFAVLVHSRGGSRPAQCGLAPHHTKCLYIHLGSTIKRLQTRNQMKPRPLSFNTECRSNLAWSRQSVCPHDVFDLQSVGGRSAVGGGVRK